MAFCSPELMASSLPVVVPCLLEVLSARCSRRGKVAATKRCAKLTHAAMAVPAEGAELRQELLAAHHRRLCALTSTLNACLVPGPGGSSSSRSAGEQLVWGLRALRELLREPVMIGFASLMM